MNQPLFVVCRCEEVTVGALEEAYSKGAHTVRQIKMKTRVTMGACQGRVCRHLIETWMNEKDPESPRDVELLSYRPPIRPITFGQLSRGE